MDALQNQDDVNKDEAAAAAKVQKAKQLQYEQQQQQTTHHNKSISQHSTISSTSSVSSKPKIPLDTVVLFMRPKIIFPMQRFKTKRDNLLKPVLKP